jgi:stage II sporulation protein D
MDQITHRLRWLFVLLLALQLLQFGCVPPPQPGNLSNIPVVRVLILENKSSVQLSATAPPLIRTANSSAVHRLDLSPRVPVSVSLESGGWRIGNVLVGSGELRIDPAADGSVYVDGRPYHGAYRLAPSGDSTFNVINDVNLEDYLKGVLASELPQMWLDETYKAQAVAARTYALYEVKSEPAGKSYDLFSDVRSQMYGGISAETDRARRAVAATTGIVVAAGPPKHERIIKAYFSSCCGGVGQSAADAFGDPPSRPLMEQSVGNLCSASPHFNWGPVVVSKADLTARIRKYGKLNNRPEQDMGGLTRIDISAFNSLGRPVRFFVTDARGAKYEFRGEELREAVNTDSTPTTKLLSSFFRLDIEPTAIGFVDGHGSGHGVGMCQWTAQRRAELGMRYDSIVMTAYPGTMLIQAY